MIDFNKFQVGDYVKVKYTTGERFKGGTIKGKITKLLLDKIPKKKTIKPYNTSDTKAWMYPPYNLALSAIKKIVEGKKIKGKNIVTWTGKAYNQAISDISKLFDTKSEVNQ